MYSRSKNSPLRVSVLGSGSGSNCQAIINAIEKGLLQVKLVCIISDVKDALILERARRHKIPAYFISGKPFKTKLTGEAELRYIDILQKHNTEIIALAGFMRILKKKILSSFPQQIINIHPSLLPSFSGKESWIQALKHGAKITGCTVHVVDEGTDTGPIIMQRAVPIYENDTKETLHSRIKKEEHKAFPEALQMLAEKEICIDGRKIHLRAKH